MSARERHRTTRVGRAPTAGERCSAGRAGPAVAHAGHDGPARPVDAAGERGSATLLVVGVVALAVVLGLACAVVARAYGVRSVAQTAADLAALAAAQSVAVPAGVVIAPGVSLAGTAGAAPTSPCDLAAESARRNGGVLSGCLLLPRGVVEVRVAVHAAVGTSVATARAGPAEARR